MGCGQGPGGSGAQRTSVGGGREAGYGKFWRSSNCSGCAGLDLRLPQRQHAGRASAHFCSGRTAGFPSDFCGGTPSFPHTLFFHSCVCHAGLVIRAAWELHLERNPLSRCQVVLLRGGMRRFAGSKKKTTRRSALSIARRIAVGSYRCRSVRGPDHTNRFTKVTHSCRSDYYSILELDGRAQPRITTNGEPDFAGIIRVGKRVNGVSGGNCRRAAG